MKRRKQNFKNLKYRQAGRSVWGHYRRQVDLHRPACAGRLHRPTGPCVATFTHNGQKSSVTYVEFFPYFALNRFSSSRLRRENALKSFRLSYTTNGGYDLGQLDHDRGSGSGMTTTPKNCLIWKSLMNPHSFWEYINPLISTLWGSKL